MDLGRTRSTLRRAAALTLAVATLAAGAGGMGGCYFPGGSMQSGGASTYESTPFFPVTVTIRNTITQEDIWTCDVPVGQQLVIWFNPDARSGDAALPDTMDWEVMPAGVRYGGLDNTTPMPRASARAVIVSKRKGPEAPVQTSAEPARPSDAGM